MAELTPQEFTKKLIARGTAAVPDFVKGVQSVSVNPMAEAVKAIPKAAQNYQAAVSSGKMERGFNRVTKEAWMKVTAEKGQQRMAQGLAGAASKIESFATQFLPYAKQVKGEVAGMPSTTLEDNIARMTHNVRRLAEFKRS